MKKLYLFFNLLFLTSSSGWRQQFINLLRNKIDLLMYIPLFLISIANAQSYQPLTLDGFNEDVIANGIGSAASSTTNYLDRDAFCIQSLDWKLTASSSALTFGLPVDGIINSVVSANPGLFFKLQDYSANNVIQLRSNGNSITSSVTGQVKAEKLYLLANSASGSSSLQCMVNFDDNSFQILSIILPDWYDGTNPPVAYLGFGRVTRLSSVLEHSISNPRLHQIALPINLENQNKEIRSISFTHLQGNGIINIFGATAELVAPCKSPETVSFSSITSSSAQVSFVPPNPLPAAGYDFEFRSSGLPESGTTGLLARGSIVNSSTTINSSNLPMGERVNFYIRSKCSASSLGEWKGPFTFTTLCVARGAFNENFESQPVGSTIDASLPSCWGKISNGNGYLYTSNASAYSGIHSLYLYNSNQTTGDLMVVSPPTNQLGSGGYRIRFRARSTFFQEVTLKVVTLENPYDTANMQVLDEIELTNSYKEYFVNVPAGTANYFGLAHGLKTGYQAIYIDDIHLEPIPPCIVPTDLTVSAVGLSTATIAWTATSSLNTDGYVYEVRTSGEAGSGTTGLAFSGRSDSNVTRVNLNDLLAGTTYHAYVKANCTATDESYWTDAVTFTPNWCMPTYQNVSSNHRITKVNIDELAFTDEITSYTQRDRTNLSIPDLQAGSSYTFNVTTTGYTVMGVAIDFNNDGVFDQNTEVLALPDYIVNNTQVYTAQVIIPNGVASGNYRMRIWNRGANAGGGMGADPCGAYNYGTWADYTVRVQGATLPPVAVNQVFCKNENKKVGDLIATGENIKWYTNETATTALLPSTLLSSGTYYATQTIGGYESVRRTAIQVEVDDPKLNSISVSSSFQYGTQTQVVLIGIRTVLGPHVLTWYETEAGGTSIPTPDINLLPVGTHVYWVSTFSKYGCESKRSKINLVVNPMSLYITPTVVNKFYGDADPELTYTIYGGYNDVPLTGSLVRDVGENAGNYAIRQGTLTASANYSLTITTAYLTILPAPLAVTADAKTKEIGAVDPILTYQVLGLKNGETAHDILFGGLTRTPGELEGIYPITQGSLALQSPNYTLTYNSANLTIESKVVTVKANTQRKNYGDADPELTYTVSGLGSTVDPETILTGSLSREPGETRGAYLITQGTLAVVSGYTLEFEGANLTVDPAVLTVAADAQTKTYGDVDPVLTYQITSGQLIGSDQLTGTLIRDAGENVGNYVINQGSLSANSNYTLAYTPSDLTITKASITGITFTDGTFTYDGTAKSIEITGILPIGAKVSYVGNSQTEAGTYTVTVTIGGDNYVGQTLSAKMIIEKAAQTITWNQNLVVGCDVENEIQLTAKSSSGLPIVYHSSNESIAKIIGDKVVFTGVGFVEITASQVGNNNFLSANSTTKTLNTRSKGMVKQKWDKVLVFDNSSNQYVKWQWYKDGVRLNGATKQFYESLEPLSGIYYVVATDLSNNQLETCPMTIVANVSTGGIKVVPNPVRQGTMFDVVANYTSTELIGAELIITDLTGKKFFETKNVRPTTKLQAPLTASVYVIHLFLSDGRKASTNMLVN